MAFQTFRDVFLAGDAGKLAEAFVEDGTYATNAGQLLEGRDAIQQAAADWFRQRPPGAVEDLDARVIRSGADGPVRWELIQYRREGHLPGHPEAGSVDEAGYAMAVFTRSGDGWLIESLVVNRR